MDDEPAFAPEEFVAEENLNFEKEVSVDEGVELDDKTVKTLNLPAPPNDEPPPPLRPFDVGPSPSTLHLHRRRGRTSTSLPKTTRLN